MQPIERLSTRRFNLKPLAFAMLSMAAGGWLPFAFGYGRVPAAGSTPAADTYNDTVTMTVTW